MMDPSPSRPFFVPHKDIAQIEFWLLEGRLVICGRDAYKAVCGMLRGMKSRHAWRIDKQVKLNKLLEHDACYGIDTSFIWDPVPVDPSVFYKPVED